MKTLIIVGHPQPGNSETQEFLKTSASLLKNITWHELAAEPVFKINDERNLLMDQQRIILQFPLYWYSAPALLKKWLDDVLPESTGFNLRGKEFGLVVSFSHAASEFQLGERVGYSFAELLSPFAALAKHFQMQLLPPFLIERFAYQTQLQRQHLLLAYQQFLELPQPQSFAMQESWFLQKLTGLIDQTEDSRLQQRLNLIKQQVAENQTELAELTQMVHDFREDDSLNGK
ncbi:NAD(P)H-dependent oxidoreductase [Liquorilactobacillus vini]|uniref:NADPH-quinone reductase n=1 Tax=Liquorilactobacillus vini DSM 20605 TaxID=1133569 RepID=A0A0R2CK33_9LACO|nr:NAD(P)H-dependent oxidoreductase [Liquorilactobacillus vini]KRM88604.1 NADPH-quinone reductase [Liquorilactobacillus vini DSM 20605]